MMLDDDLILMGDDVFISREGIRRVLRLTRSCKTPHTTLTLWSFLWFNLESETGHVAATPTDLAKDTGILPAEVSRSMTILAGLGVLSRVRNGAYKVNPAIIWRGTLEGRQAAMASFVEQHRKNDAACRDGFVYIIESGGLVKIGMSKDPESRIKGMLSGICWPIKRTATFKVSDARRVERQAHQHFNDRRCVREWFDVPFDEANAYLEAAE